jgi:hypothetical protein
MGAAHQRYGGLSAAGKKALVDELMVITGYHRKSVLRALNRTPIPADGDGDSGEPHRHHRCRYGPEVMEALVPLWEASDRLCGKRLQALLPLLLESLERHGHLALDPEVREKLLMISSATIDRLLAPVRKTSPGNGWAPTTRVSYARWSGASGNGEQPEQSACWGRCDQPERGQRQGKEPILSRHQLEVTLNDAKRPLLSRSGHRCRSGLSGRADNEVRSGR